MSQDLYLHNHSSLSLIFIPSIIPTLQMKKERHKEKTKEFAQAWRSGNQHNWDSGSRGNEMNAVPLSLRLKCPWNFPAQVSRGPNTERPVRPGGYLAPWKAFQRSRSEDGSKYRSEEALSGRHWLGNFEHKNNHWSLLGVEGVTEIFQRIPEK